MDLNKMIAELKAERDILDDTILTFERIAAGRSRRRGRPPSWLQVVPRKRGRPPGSKNKPKET
jgi:hypothetical protein